MKYKINLNSLLSNGQLTYAKYCGCKYLCSIFKLEQMYVIPILLLANLTETARTKGTNVQLFALGPHCSSSGSVT